MYLLLTLALLLPQALETQTDWVGGPGILGPVTTWQTSFHQSTDINYNISGQISLVSITIPGGWSKHSIQTDSRILGQSGIYPADFDGDGDFDLASWIDNPDAVRIYKNQKVETNDVNFIVQTNLSLPNTTGSYGLLWCGDLDNDGDADIVVPCTPGPIWFENTGSFNFTSHTIGSITYDRASCDVGDVDNDGDKDILIYGTNNNKLDLWRNTGAMNFTRQNINTTGNWWRVMFGHLNNDNFLDIFNSGDVYINSGGNFPSTPDWTAPQWNDIDGIWIRDFDNDADNDLLIGFQWASTPEMAWFENDGSGISYTKHTICTGSQAYEHSDACIGEDIDQDGVPDVIGVYQKVGYFRQYPIGTFTLNDIDNNFPDAHWCFVTNLDFKPGGSDFDLDILASRVGEFAWWENKAAGVQYADLGSLESSILEKLDANSWQKLYWVGARPVGTTLNLYVRSGADASSIQTNAWQGPFQVPTGTPSGDFDISSVTTPGHHYFQYKVEMTTNIAKDLSPVLYEISVEYQVSGVGIHDVGVLEILAPIGDIEPGTLVTPTALFKNFGDFDENFFAFFQIGCIYFDFRFISLTAGETATVTFTPWTAEEGYYSEGASTFLETDENQTNDTVTDWLRVVSPPGSSADPFSPCGYNVPLKFELFKPAPNPTANNLSISYAISNPSQVEIEICDINGRVIKNLMTEVRPAGYYRIGVNCTDFGAGVYIVKMKAGKFEAVEKFVVTK
ncbi:MAG: FG-GAP-like repeat-containing protein [candidate division WOR-3 bacterium]